MPTFEEQFAAFSKFGDTRSKGTTITLTQSDKWMKQANIFNAQMSTIDTGIHFKKLKTLKSSLDEYLQFLEDLANTKGVDLEEMKNQMIFCGEPGVRTIAATSTKVKENVDRMTDASKYTATHKERFDASGKGLGKEHTKYVHDDGEYESYVKK